VAFPADKPARSLSRLAEQFGSLVPDPPQLRDCVGPHHFEAGTGGRDETDAPPRRVHGKVDVLDFFARERDGDVAEPDRLHRQYPGWFLTSSNSASVLGAFRTE